MSKKEQTLLGAHMSIAGGIDRAIDRALEAECTTMQIFTKNNKAWFGNKLPDDKCEKFKKKLRASGLQKIMAHASYLINLGSKNKDVARKSRTSLEHELGRCDILNITYLVLHPGAHRDMGEEVCIKQIAQGINSVFEKNTTKATILLETTAGQGTNVGYTFAHLGTIYRHCKPKRRIGICLDTCHVFAAGYNISTEQGYEAMWDEFEIEIGMHHLKALHLNDSKTTCGSRKDRHEKIGKGQIPLATFKKIMRDTRLTTLPKVLETPILTDPVVEYKKEILLLRKMQKR